MSFREFINEKQVELGDLQVLWNKYKFNKDQGKDSEAEKFKTKAEKMWKTLSKRDSNARNAAGKLWKDVINEGTIFKLMYKAPKDRKFKQVVEMASLDALIKAVPQYAKQLEKDYGLTEIDFIIVDNKKIVWSSDDAKTSKFAKDNKLTENDIEQEITEEELQEAEITGDEMDTLVVNFLNGVQKVVEIAVAMHQDDIEKDPTKGINKALDYVLNEYKKNKSPLSEDFLVVAIKTALFKSLKEQGYEDQKFKKNIMKDLKKIR